MTDRISRSRLALTVGLCATFGLALPACERLTTEVAGDAAATYEYDAPGAAAPLRADPALGAQVAMLRAATARYHQIDRAVEAGHDVLVRHPDTGAACLESSAGGMGRHMLNLARLDDEVSITEPEVLIYEPTKNGRMRLVGVEYAIPYTIRGVNEDPPELFGRPFERNATFKLWALHVYVWKHNPDGLFAAWNPAITCSHDPEA